MNCKLSDCASIIAGGTPKTNNPDYWGGAIPWISIADLNTSGRYVNDTDKKITQKGLDNSSTHMLDNDDIIISARGTVGLIRMIGRPMAFNQSCFGIRANSNIDPVFLYYSLIFAVKKLKQSSFGSVFSSINSTILEELNIWLPSKKEQTIIANYISKLDDLIAIICKINDNLSTLIYHIYRSYRNDASVLTTIGDLKAHITDLVSNGSFATIKKNVKVTDIPDYAYFIRNVDLKSNNYEKYVSKATYDFLVKSSLFGGELLFANVADIGSVHRCPVLEKPMTLGNNLILFDSSKDCYYNYYLDNYFKSEEGQHTLDSITIGSVQGKISKTNFKKAELTVPSVEQLNSFNNAVQSLYELRDKLLNVNKQLESLKDAILPKLMSGEIDVSTLEIPN